MTICISSEDIIFRFSMCINWSIVFGEVDESLDSCMDESGSIFNELRLDVLVEMVSLVEAIRHDRRADEDAFRMKLSKYHSMATDVMMHKWFEEHAGGSIDLCLVRSLFKVLRLARCDWETFRGVLNPSVMGQQSLNKVLKTDIYVPDLNITFWDTIMVLVKSLNKSNRDCMMQSVNFIALYAGHYDVDVDFWMFNYLKFREYV